MESSPDEVVIAVMGITGSGKSTFIRTVTNNKSVYVGHGLESATSEVQSYRFTHKGTRYVLVDTPGFNDHSVSDEEIMDRVLEWLEKSFRVGTRLNGLIYIHRIIDPKMQGSALSNMRMFRQLCGPTCFPNIILATTFWDNVSEFHGKRREEELKTSPEFWAGMVKKGSQVMRLGRSREDGLKLLEMLARKEKVTLHVQDEVVNKGKARQDTAAVQAVNSDLAKQKRELEEKLRQEKIMAEVRIANQERARKEQLARERRAQKEREESAARARAIQKEAMERRWRLEYEEKQRKLKEEQAEKERIMREAERVAREREKAEAERKAREQKLKDEKAAYYRNFVCNRDGDYRYIICSKCSGKITSGWYWHCCFCYGDDYDHCSTCGGACAVYEHPWMKKRYQRYHPPDSDCIVM